MAGFFRALFGGAEKKPEKKQPPQRLESFRKDLFGCGQEIHRDQFLFFFSASCGPVMAKQRSLAQLVVQGRNWNLDLGQGVLSFGEDAYPAQLLGSQSDVSGTWLWAWANPSQFSQKVLAQSLELKSLGEQWGLKEFTQAEFPVDDLVNGYTLSMVAAALRGESCLFRAPYANGAAYLGFTGLPEQVFSPMGAQELVKLATDCIQQYPLEHKLFLSSLLYQNGCPFQWEGEDSLTAQLDGAPFTFQFQQVEGGWRLSEIKGTLSKPT